MELLSLQILMLNICVDDSPANPVKSIQAPCSIFSKLRGHAQASAVTSAFIVKLNISVVALGVNSRPPLNGYLKLVGAIVHPLGDC